jgi:hypothetical protein
MRSRIKKDKLQSEPMKVSVGSLVEALYDSVPKNIRNAQHKTLLVILALKDLQTRIRPA